MSTFRLPENAAAGALANVASQVAFPDIVFPADMHPHAREQITILDREAQLIAARLPSAQHYRAYAAQYRKEGLTGLSEQNAAIADLIAMDPRLEAARAMDAASWDDGTRRYFLHELCWLIRAQRRLNNV